MNARDALKALREGNRRFVADPTLSDWALKAFDPAGSAEGQTPIAAVLGCSDSRVPVEILFRQGPGRIFVVRVAGNVIGPTQLASLEFAVVGLGVRLLVVLGHSNCGAVGATLEAMRGKQHASLPSLGAVTDRIEFGITGVDPRAPDALDSAVRRNVGATVAALRHAMETMGHGSTEDEVLVTGALYHLERAEVEWLNGEGEAVD